MAGSVAASVMEGFGERSCDDMSSRLNVTKNPFDSILCEKENFPAYSPSILVKLDTPRVEDGFRWSIDQIATMRPTEIEEFPNQEYSVSYDKKEDEERDQQAIDEYFSKVTLPSPWLLQKSGCDLKRVTFSPHPPATRIIHEANDSTTSIESLEQTGVTFLADACCQTTLTIPVDFDFETLVGKHMFTYFEEKGEAKGLMISSLRRKLFDQENAPVSSKLIAKATPAQDAGLATPSPTTPVYNTSSPCKAFVTSTSIVEDRSPELGVFPDESPPISPLVDVQFSSPDCSPKQASNVGSPENGQTLSLSSFDVSPIRSCERNAFTTSRDSGLCNHNQSLVDMSFEGTGDVSGKADRRESTRDQMIITPDVSPIRDDVFGKTFVDEKSRSHPTVSDSMDLHEYGTRNIRESTATNMKSLLGFSSIEVCDTKQAEAKLGNEQSATPICDALNNFILVGEGKDTLRTAETPRAVYSRMPQSKLLPSATTPLKGILKKREQLGTPRSVRHETLPFATHSKASCIDQSVEPVSGVVGDESIDHAPGSTKIQHSMFSHHVEFCDKDKENGTSLSPIGSHRDDVALPWAWRQERLFDESSLLFDSPDAVSVKSGSALRLSNRLQSSIDWEHSVNRDADLKLSSARAKPQLNSTALSCAGGGFPVERPSVNHREHVASRWRRNDSSEEMRRLAILRPHFTSPAISLASLSLRSRARSTSASRLSAPVLGRRTIYRSNTWPRSLAGCESRTPLVQGSPSTGVSMQSRSSYRRSPNQGLPSRRDLDWDTLKDYTSIKDAYDSFLPSPVK